MIALRRRIEIQGVVQGVGFRPYVYRLAAQFGIFGWVLNSPDGVVIEAEGEAVEAFLYALQSQLPPLARIDRISVAELPATREHAFHIRESVGGEGQFSLVPPDIATCPECTAEFLDPSNRRYLYPFTNCTNCGPRYSIIRDVPYDRAKTTMAEFKMCPACQAEYEDPGHRRFHAEPNACPDCGPSLSEDPVEIRLLLQSGLILAIRGLGGFHLVCDATNIRAVETLRERKRRSGKAFAVMVRDLAVARELCEIVEAEQALLEGSRKPIVLLRKKAEARIAPAVAPNQSRLGVMLPYTPLHHLLFDETLPALVMTSGNLSEEPIVSRNAEAELRLHDVADHFIFHNREIRTRVDDSVMQIFAGKPYPVRRSRGYAPEPIELHHPAREILACGGELKNTFCLTKGRYAILSQHIGDLENLETMEFFRETLSHLQRFFRVSPVAVAHDLHPRYLSTQFALRESGLPAIGIQHHHAHIAACMADNGLEGKVIGVAMDGTGYGTDGRIWGGEFLVSDFAGYERYGHLRYVPLAGGDAAVRQPWRSALAYCRDAGVDFAPALAAPKDLRIVGQMLDKGLQCVDTSSCGRLFDAVASVLNVRQQTTYEGQAAIELEMLAADTEGRYPFTIHDGNPFQADLRTVISAITVDLHSGTPAAVIAGRFHNTMADVILQACQRIRSHSQLERVCLSGGCFQNLRLLGLTVESLRSAGFTVYHHQRVPTNDGGLALGQALIASELLSVPR